MEIDWFTLARVLHVVSVVGWIGGVWFVTFVIMPAIARAEPPQRRLIAFHRIEQVIIQAAAALLPWLQ